MQGENFVMIFEGNCIEVMKELENDSVDFLLTDIPYAVVSRNSNGLRNLNKDKADILTFNLNDFLKESYRVTKNSLCIFCSKEQFSDIYDFFAREKGTVRPIIWEKTNPSPMNGQYIYLSGVEFAVWFKKSGAKTFNAYCKNTVFKYPNGKRTFHPTQKNLNLFEELITDNTNKGDIVFDPCMGSGTTAIAAIKTQREWVGCELDSYYYVKAKERIMNSYDTSNEEISVTRDWCNKVGIDFIDITKSTSVNKCDTVIEMSDGTLITCEVKSDDKWRFSKWHEYGIDMISMFRFKEGKTWDTRVHKADELNSFLDTVDFNRYPFKWGKIAYSTADIWIFFTKNVDASYYWLEGYDMRKLRNETNFPNLIAGNSKFARNSKLKDDVSGDWFNSACFFTNPKILSRWLIKKQ